jgi:hypothetical protein
LVLAREHGSTCEACCEVASSTPPKSTRYY